MKPNTRYFSNFQLQNKKVFGNLAIDKFIDVISVILKLENLRISSATFFFIE